MGWRGLRHYIESSRDEVPIVSRWKDKIVGPLTEHAGGDWLLYKVVSQDVCLVASDGVEEIMVSVLCEGGEVRWQITTAPHPGNAQNKYFFCLQQWQRLEGNVHNFLVEQNIELESSHLPKKAATYPAFSFWNVGVSAFIFCLTSRIE